MGGEKEGENNEREKSPKISLSFRPRRAPGLSSPEPRIPRISLLITAHRTLQKLERGRNATEVSQQLGVWITPHHLLSPLAMPGTEQNRAATVERGAKVASMPNGRRREGSSHPPGSCLASPGRINLTKRT